MRLPGGVIVKLEEYPRADDLMGGVDRLLEKSPSLESQLKEETGRISVNNHLFWAAARLTDFDDSAFRSAYSKGLYLHTVEEGRQTTGATSIRHVLFWLRIEAGRLVPERFEGYDVPIGATRSPAHLVTTATPLE